MLLSVVWVELLVVSLPLIAYSFKIKTSQPSIVLQQPDTLLRLSFRLQIIRRDEITQIQLVAAAAHFGHSCFMQIVCVTHLHTLKIYPGKETIAVVRPPGATNRESYDVNHTQCRLHHRFVMVVQNPHHRLYFKRMNQPDIASGHKNIGTGYDRSQRVCLQIDGGNGVTESIK